MGDKWTSKQIEFHHGKGVNGRRPRRHWVEESFEWSRRPFLCLTSAVKLQVMFFFSFFPSVCIVFIWLSSITLASNFR